MTTASPCSLARRPERCLPLHATGADQGFGAWDANGSVNFVIADSYAAERSLVELRSCGCAAAAILQAVGFTAMLQVVFV